VLRLLDGSAGTRCGYLLKDNVTRPAELVTSLERIHAGEVVVDRELISGLLAHRREVDPLYDLTDREREVLALMAEGRSNKAIADRLFVSDHTVEKHIKNIFGTLRLPLSPDDHRRVLAVVTYLDSE
jgi:serine/threonine-protein kinase PknK